MNDLQRYLVEEAVEDYEAGRLTRRQALKAIAGVAGGALATRIAGPAKNAPEPEACAVGRDKSGKRGSFIEVARCGPLGTRLRPSPLIESRAFPARVRVLESRP